MRRRTIVSLEQALSLPSATLRFAQLGWRVIRLEATPQGAGLPGDPNRYIGARTDPARSDDDRRSYFVAPNVGKEAIALNLKDPGGQALLRKLLVALDVDVFCCNVVPARYRSLGIDYATLCTAKPDLIWAGISALGPRYPEATGYDPVIQAMCGYMELTGDPHGPPTLMGLPVIDLKAGDEIYANVMRALLERAESGKGQEIHVSMLQAAASWLITVLPMVDFGCDDSEITRSGNEHRKFVPTNVYAARDGFIYLAVGSDAQWQKLTSLATFASLAAPGRVSNEGRNLEREALQRDMARAIATRPVEALLAELRAAGLPATQILNIRQTRELSQLQEQLTRTQLPDGRTIRMQPMAVDVAGAPQALPFAHHYGADTRPLLAEAGLAVADIEALARAGIIP